MNRYITEFIGTFFLVLTIGLSGNPLAIGAMLMVMIYMGGPISGGHFNPAVSLGVLIRKKLDGRDFVFYIIAQTLGSLIAAILIYFFKGVVAAAPSPVMGNSIAAVVLAELLFTFALVSVVLNTATTRKAANNSYFGLAIGFTVFASAVSIGPISGAALNPAVALGLFIMQAIYGGSAFGNLIIYLVAPLLGGTLAGLIFWIMNPDERAEYDNELKNKERLHDPHSQT